MYRNQNSNETSLFFSYFINSKSKSFINKLVYFTGVTPMSDFPTHATLNIYVSIMY